MRAENAAPSLSRARGLNTNPTTHNTMPSYTAGKPENKSFTVPPGEYTLRVVEAEEDTSKNGNDMIKLTLVVVKDNGKDGPRLFDYLVFSESSFWKIDTFLKSAGEHPGEGASVDLAAEKCIGWTVRAKLKIESYDGRESNKIESYLFEDEF